MCINFTQQCTFCFICFLSVHEQRKGGREPLYLRCILNIHPSQAVCPVRVYTPRTPLSRRHLLCPVSIWWLQSCSGRCITPGLDGSKWQTLAGKEDVLSHVRTSGEEPGSPPCCAAPTPARLESTADSSRTRACQVLEIINQTSGMFNWRFLNF